MQKLFPLSRTEIIDKLCYHDPRRDTVPELYRDTDPQPANCYCDNCFYGKHRLASQLLDALDTIDDLNTQLDVSLD